MQHPKPADNGRNLNVDIVYNGEWTWAASLGRLLIALAFAGGLHPPSVTPQRSQEPGAMAAMGRWGFRSPSRGHLWRQRTRLSADFLHRYEFEYIWKHLNDAMSGLSLASFWGGQEGGFLLWMCWMLVLGFVFLRRNPAHSRPQSWPYTAVF